MLHKYGTNNIQIPWSEQKYSPNKNTNVPYKYYKLRCRFNTQIQLFITEIQIQYTHCSTNITTNIPYKYARLCGELHSFELYVC